MAANVLIIMGIAITWGIFGKIGNTNNVSYIPIIVCNILSGALMGLFYFFDSREIYLVRQHIPRQYFTLYFLGGFIFVFNLIFVFIMIGFIDQIFEAFNQSSRVNVSFGIIFGISALISLVTIGVYRYARYKIDLTLYLRRRGKTPNDLPKLDSDKATSGITEHADQK
jgi:hypothetical protein